MRLKKIGQSVLEYALLLAIVSAAFMAMGLYMRRSVMGSLYKIDEQVAGKPEQDPILPPTPAIP